MTQEQFYGAVRINGRIEELARVKKESPSPTTVPGAPKTGGHVK